jgi:glutamate formiminotransferase
MLECVPNLAAGRDQAVLDDLADACGPALLDLHTDVDHHRSVFTVAGPGPADAEVAMTELARRAAARVSLVGHRGAHPRLGVLDVVPFVALDEPAETARAAAQAFGRWLGATFAVPVFFYGDADPAARTLPSVRAAAFTGRAPDVGPGAPHPRLGASAVGARPPLVAVNCWLDRDDLTLARALARSVRARDGGLPGVRALGFRLASCGRVQVSMNVTDLAATGVEAACTAVQAGAEAAGAQVERVEWVGLLPEAEVARCSPAFRAWSSLDRSRTIEARLAEPRR